MASDAIHLTVYELKVRKSRRRRRGAAIVESAIVLPLCLVFILNIFDFGRLIMMRHLLNNAARSAARLAVANTATLATANIQNQVTSCLSGFSLNSMTIQVYQVDPTSGANLGAWNNTPLGSSIAVEIDGNFQPVIPIVSFIPNPTAITVKATMLCETN